jgi:YggT family protein
MVLSPVIWLINALFNLAFWIILASVIISWLTAFGVINTSNPYVRQVARALHQVTEPLLRPIRRFLPAFGGLDFSPIVLLLALEFLRQIINNVLIGLL